MPKISRNETQLAVKLNDFSYSRAYDYYKLPKARALNITKENRNFSIFSTQIEFTNPFLAAR
jgi:hypothetical protein